MSPVSPFLQRERRNSRVSSASSNNSGYTRAHFLPKPKTGEINPFAHVGPSKELVQAKFQRQRLEKNAAKMAKMLDVFRPKSADYGSGVSALGSGVRRASDVPFGSKENDNHLHHNLNFGELWDPYSSLQPSRPASVGTIGSEFRPGSRNSNAVPLQMGIGLGQLWRPDPKAPPRKETKLVLRTTHVEMDRTMKRMIVNLLEKCRIKATALFKCMKASDDPDPTTGVQSGKIPTSQFELCIRSAAISAPRAVFNTLFEMVGDDEGNVDYIKFLEDLDIEEGQMMAEIKDRRSMLRSQMETEKRDRDRRMEQHMQMQRARSSTPQNPYRAAPTEVVDQRLCVEIDSPEPLKRQSGIRAKSWFKPRHLKSAYGHDLEAQFCLPGGPLGTEMRDASKQPPIESHVLEHELHHVRDHVLVEKVSRQRAARNNSGNDDAFFG